MGSNLMYIFHINTFNGYICVFWTRVYAYFWRTYRLYALLLNTHIYGGTKHAYICVQNTLMFAYETRIYMRTSELRVLLADVTNSTQRILIRKLGEKYGVMVSYCKILHIKVKNIR